MRFSLKRLSYRLILSLTLVVALVEGISSYFSAKVQEDQILDAMILGADQLSRGIASATWQSMLVDHREAAYDLMQTIATKQGIKRIRIFNKEGRIMFSTQEGDSGNVDTRAEACFMCHASEQALVRVDVPSRARLFSTPEGGKAVAIVTPIYNEPSCSDAPCHAHPPEQNVLGVLDVALDADPVEEEVAGIWRKYLLTTAASVLLMSLVIFLLTRQFVDTPIRRLIEGTRAVSEMQLDKPIEVKATSELADLARSFNQMREKLNRALAELNEITQGLEAKVEERTQQLKETHEKLIQTDRLVSLGQLCASVAHEINNPISGVLNFSMLLQRIMDDKGIPPDRVREFQIYLARIINETSRVGKIVTDLLAFSRRSRPMIERANLNRIIDRTLTVIAHKMRLMNVTPVPRLLPDLPLVPCDSSLMQQVVVNLMMNGAESIHGKEEGRVWIETRLSPDGNSVIMTVEDNGEGIPKENLGKIFDPFFTTKEEGKGVGLGLAVVYGIVDSHGGGIAVQSTVGKGTLFTVSLPIHGVPQGGKEETTVDVEPRPIL
ncbi:MAG: HAMP domain-containing protein [Ignavibacteria bacterium]|nr:HAMP domain-containing protein [Ignavibacteria bacterium]